MPVISIQPQTLSHISATLHSHFQGRVEPKDQQTRGIVWEWQAMDHVAPDRGRQDATSLDNGKTFICVGVSGEFFEVDAEVNQLWAYENHSLMPKNTTDPGLRKY